MRFTLVLAALVLSAQSLKIERLNRDEEARAIENAVVNRVVPKLDSEVAHADDKDHSAARSAFNGNTPSSEDYMKKMGALAKDQPILGKVMERLEHPYYPYK